MKTQVISGRKIGEEIGGGSIGLVGLFGSYQKLPDRLRKGSAQVGGEG